MTGESRSRQQDRRVEQAPGEGQGTSSKSTRSDFFIG